MFPRCFAPIPKVNKFVVDIRSINWCSYYHSNIQASRILQTSPFSSNYETTQTRGIHELRVFHVLCAIAAASSQPRKANISSRKATSQTLPQVSVPPHREGMPYSKQSTRQPAPIISSNFCGLHGSLLSHSPSGPSFAACPSKRTNIIAASSISQLLASNFIREVSPLLLICRSR